MQKIRNIRKISEYYAKVYNMQLKIKQILCAELSYGTFFPENQQLLFSHTNFPIQAQLTADSLDNKSANNTPNSNSSSLLSTMFNSSKKPTTTSTNEKTSLSNKASFDGGIYLDETEKLDSEIAALYLNQKSNSFKQQTNQQVPQQQKEQPSTQQQQQQQQKSTTTKK